MEEYCQATDGTGGRRVSAASLSMLLPRFTSVAPGCFVLASGHRGLQLGFLFFLLVFVVVLDVVSCFQHSCIFSRLGFINLKPGFLCLMFKKTTSLTRERRKLMLQQMLQPPL
jgi:hypothetical protein